jgi:hypothetical protein
MLPEILILKPSRARQQRLLSIGALFTVVGIFLIFDHAAPPHRGFAHLVTDVLGPSGIGWVTTMFFGACTIVFVINMLPNASFLELSPTGFLSGAGRTSGNSAFIPLAQPSPSASTMPRVWTVVA